MWECSSRCEQLHIFHLETGPQQDLVVTVWVWRNVVLLYVNCVYGFTGIGFWKDQNLSMTCLWWLKRDSPNINTESSQKWNDVLTYKTKKQSCLSLFPAQMCCNSLSFSPCLTTFVNPVISCLDPAISRSTEEVTTTTQKCNSASLTIHQNKRQWRNHLQRLVLWWTVQSVHYICVKCGCINRQSDIQNIIHDLLFNCTVTFLPKTWINGDITQIWNGLNRVIFE